MPERLILLPGWSMAPASLAPLREALLHRAPDWHIDTAPLPTLCASSAWLDELDTKLPRDSWLIGWSLGGMLAAQLAVRRGHACRGLIGLCSNMSYRDREDWPCAMPRATLAAFQAACQQDPAPTLKRFGLLVAQGARDARGLVRQVHATQLPADTPALATGLQLLDELDSRPAVQGYAGPQLHLYAERDVLVPANAATALQSWHPGAQVQVISEACHGLPLEQPEAVADAIVAFISRHPQHV